MNTSSADATNAGSGQSPADGIETVQIDVDGMTCAACQSAVQTALLKAPGVRQATVSLMTNQATVSFDRDKAVVAKLIEQIENAGYDASLPSVAQTAFAAQQRQDEAVDKEYSSLRLRAWLALIAASLSMLLSMPLMAGAHGHSAPGFFQPLMSAVDAVLQWVFPWLYSIPASSLRWALGALAIAVMAGPGRSFYVRAFVALRHRSADMNTLVAMGTGAAFAYSAAVTVAPRFFVSQGVQAEVYYEAVVFILALVLLGNSFERQARQRASSAIRELAGLQPTTARKSVGDRTEEVRVDYLSPGDLLLVPEGERIPVDGVVEHGTASIDVSMLTGESMPVAVSEGDTLTGGTLLLEGTLRYRVTRAGHEGTLANMVQMMRDAQSSQAPVQRLADRISGLFVPVVLALAALTLAAWLLFPAEPVLAQALTASVAVLIIACPCAMGLAVPTAVLVSTGRGARMGMLVKGGEPLERLQAVKAIIFDKTGTLTEGVPQLTDWASPDDLHTEAPKSLLAELAALEQASAHPLAQAIVREANKRQLPLPGVENIRNFPGQGISGMVAGANLSAGTATWLHTLGVHGVEPADHLAGAFREAGKTTLLVARNSSVVAIVAIADQVRPSAASAIESLRAMGVHVAMLSGDRRATAEAVAAQLGIHDVRAEVLPDDKLAAIRSMQQKYGAVAMVGDGVNDAPALAAADVGIAMGKGAQTAAQAASVILLRNDPTSVPDVITLSRITMRTMKQNLFWAFIYNVLGIPVAAGLLYPFTGLLLSPVIASAAMAFSSVSVVANSLRLRNMKLSHLPRNANGTA